MQQDSCAQALTLPSAEYQAARAQARLFLIAVTTNLEIGRVVSQNGDLRSRRNRVGDASRIAEQTKPRDL